MDDFNNLIDTGRFLRVMADIETGKDEPEPHQFKRDQHLTPVEMFRERVLHLVNEQVRGAVKSDERYGRLMLLQEQIRNLRA